MYIIDKRVKFLPSSELKRNRKRSTDGSKEADEIIGKRIGMGATLWFSNHNLVRFS